MSATTPREAVRTSGAAARRGGYVAAIAVNALMLYIVTHLLTWDVLPFLTDDFTRVLPLLRVSLLATIFVNALYVLHDGQVFRSTTQLALSGIALAVTAQMYDVFPFDFSTFATDWAPVARGVLVVALVGIAVSMVVEVVRLVGVLVRWSTPTA